MKDLRLRAWHKKEKKMYPVRQLRFPDGLSAQEDILVDIGKEKQYTMKSGDIVSVVDWQTPEDVELLEYENQDELT